MTITGSMTTPIVDYITIRETHWFEKGVCFNTDDSLCEWVPETATVKTDAKAKAICATCPVRGQCLVSDFYESLQLGLTDGVRGGLSAKERVALFTEWEPFYKTPVKRERVNREIETNV